MFGHRAAVELSITGRSTLHTPFAHHSFAICAGESFESTESRLNRLALEPWRLDTAVSSCQPMRVTRVALIYCTVYD